jgi:hypothetical protein
MGKPLGYVLDDAPSTINGLRVITILLPPKGNRKIGAMWQTFHLLADVAPHEAVKTGADEAVCGACPLRPSVVKAAKELGEKRTPCYVVTFQAPLSIYRAWLRGAYEPITPEAARILLRGADLRLGAYGDPASVRFSVWQRLGVGSGEFRHTGYTHAWLVDGFDERALSLMMASLDSKSAERADRLPSSARTYRIVASVDDIRADEVQCPYQTRGVQCSACGLCAGTSRNAKSVAVLAH